MQSNFFTKLTIVLLYALTVSCMPFADQDSEVRAPDGAFYNYNRIPYAVAGPVSAEVYDMHPKLSSLGEYNDKHWYIERVYYNYDQARSFCSTLGMSIARTDNQRELNFLYDVTGTSDLPWIGAVLPNQLNDFRWDDTDDEYPDSIYYIPSTQYALRLNRVAGGQSSVTPALVNGVRYALCTIP